MLPGGIPVHVVRTRDWYLRIAVHPYELLCYKNETLDRARTYLVAIAYKRQGRVFGDIPIPTEYDFDVRRCRTWGEVYTVATWRPSQSRRHWPKKRYPVGHIMLELSDTEGRFPIRSASPSAGFFQARSLRMEVEDPTWVPSPVSERRSQASL